MKTEHSMYRVYFTNDVTDKMPKEFKRIFMACGLEDLAKRIFHWVKTEKLFKQDGSYTVTVKTVKVEVMEDEVILSDHYDQINNR